MNIFKKILGLDEEARLRRLAEAGDSQSGFQLALCIIKSRQAKGEILSNQEQAEVYSLLEKSANAGIIAAAYELGVKFGETGWLRHAARNGHIDAAVSLARQAKWLRDFTEIEIQEVFDLALKAKQAGNKGAASALQDMMLLNLGSHFQPDEYFHLLSESPDQFLLTKSRLAWCHLLGIGCPRLEHKADKLFKEIVSQTRIDVIYNIDTESPDMWVYRPSHPNDKNYLIANVAKYIVKHMGGAVGFNDRLADVTPKASFIAHLAISSDQIPHQALQKDNLLESSAQSGFPPAMFHYAMSLRFGDQKRSHMIKKAAQLGYTPAQVELAKKSESNFEKLAWKTLIFAQESYYGFRHGMERENLDADMEDFILRGVGNGNRESSYIKVQPSEYISKSRLDEFYDILIKNYQNHVKPFKPVSEDALNSAIFNVVQYANTNP